MRKHLATKAEADILFGMGFTPPEGGPARGRLAEICYRRSCWHLERDERKGWSLWHLEGGKPRLLAAWLSLGLALGRILDHEMGDVDLLAKPRTAQKETP